MSSRLMMLTGLAAVAAVALAWSAFAADDEDRDRGGRGERFEIPVPPPPGGEGDQMFRFGPPPGMHGEEGRRGAIHLAPPHHGPLGPDGGELTWGETRRRAERGTVSNADQ